MTEEQLTTALKNISDELNTLKQNINSIVETQNRIGFLTESQTRTLVAKNVMNLDELLSGRHTYIKFYQKLSEINQIEKLSEKIAAVKEYNTFVSKTSRMVIYADDTNILSSVAVVEKIPESIYDLILSLPHTAFFKEGLTRFLDKPEVVVEEETEIPTKKGKVMNFPKKNNKKEK